MPILSDYLLRTTAVLPGLFVRVINNATAVAYISDAAADASGKYTFNAQPPIPGTYTVSTSPTGAAPWTATGDTNYIVPVSAGDDVALRSLTILPSSPYTPSALATPGYQAMPYGSKTSISVGPTGLNLQAAGADMSGATAVDAVFTTAKAQLPSGGGRIYVPPGILSTTLGLVVPSGVSFLGAGGGHAFPEVLNAPMTKINYTGASNASAIVLSTDNTKPYVGTIAGFMVDAEYLAGNAFKILEASAAKFEDVNAWHSTADCVLLQPTGALGGHIYLCAFDRVMAHDCNGNGWRLNGFSAAAGAITLCTLRDCRYSANGGTPVSIAFQKFADTNTLIGGRIEANVANMTGLVFNSQSPAADAQVYSNRLFGVTLDGLSLAGQLAILQNENTFYINLVAGCSFGGGWTTSLSTPNTSGSTAGGAGIYVDMCSGFTPAKRAVTAGASPYTYTNRDGYQEMLFITAVNGLTAMTYKTQAGASILAGIPWILNPGDAVIMTWTTTAPTFEILPMPVT